MRLNLESSAKLTEISDSQWKKQASQMISTEDGIVMDAKPAKAKADFSIRDN
jgi:hypothetical protein